VRRPLAEVARGVMSPVDARRSVFVVRLQLDRRAVELLDGSGEFVAATSFGPVVAFVAVDVFTEPRLAETLALAAHRTFIVLGALAAAAYVVRCAAETVGLDADRARVPGIDDLDVAIVLI
jgi:hypothetical protein